MSGGDRPAFRRFAVPLAFAAVLVLSSPYVGQLRAFVRSAFPEAFRYIIGGGVAAAILVALGAAIRSIRTERLLRYGLLAAAVLLGAVYAQSIASGDSNIDVVERFHFVEYGVLAFLFYRAWRPVDDGAVVVLALVAGFIVATFDEWLQWFVPARVGEMRDVFLDGAALVCGLMFSIAVDPVSFSTARVRRRSVELVAWLGAAALVAFALFLQTIHLGYEVRDPAAGAFRSRYQREELERIQQDRASRWLVGPPVALRRFSREDQYLAEGVWHTRARNEAWARGDLAASLGENRILEKFFAPVLDTKTYEPGSGQRWPPEQAADAEHRAGAFAGTYVSHAEPLPLLLWPRWVFWATVAALVCVSLGTARTFRTP